MIDDDETMVMDMEKIEILSRVSSVVKDIDEVIYKSKYYDREVTREDLERFAENLKFIVRTFS